MSNAEIQMLDYEKPGLETGEYQLKIEQSIQGSGISDTFTNKSIKFLVEGERFTLSPDSVHVCFPPEGNLGRHTDVLPHISLKRSTLPWERSAYGNDDYEPWLALLLFDETEVVAGDVVEQTLTLQQLRNGEPVKLGDNTEVSALFPLLTLEPGQVDEDKVQVINVKRSLLEKVIPSGSELKKLSHVRRRVEGEANDLVSELSVVVANRLPQEGSETSVYCVSMENRYNDDGTFNHNGAGEDDYIRLVTLKKWGFASLPDDGKNFEELVEDIDTGSLSLDLKATSDPDSSTLDRYCKAGYVLLPHRLRQCDQTYSWYHSPLNPQQGIAAEFTSDEKLPEFADALVRYHQDIGMFDTSYAAAFELGRMLALEDNKFAAALYQWKQQYNETALAEEQSAGASRLIGAPMQSDGSEANVDEDELEATIRQRLTDLHNLVNVPFSYLVPDDAMLPEETIRFFELDRHWVESLLYGAFSIGGIVRTKPTKNLTDVLNGFYNADQPVSGFIIRSQLVSGYPDLQVDGLSSHHSGNPSLDAPVYLNARRIDRIRPDVMMGLFDGNAATLELYLKPEGLKFGLDIESGVLSKDLILSDGSRKTIGPEEGQSWWKDETNRILNIDLLAQDIQDGLGLTDAISEAVFSMQMLDGSNKGRFSITQS